MTWLQWPHSVGTMIIVGSFAVYVYGVIKMWRAHRRERRAPQVPPTD